MLEGFGIRLKSMREQKGLSQEQLAELVGVSLSSLRAYEKIVNDSSRNKPPIDTIIKIADTLDVSLDYLCRGKDEKLHEGNAVPILRALTDIVELLAPNVVVETYENDITGPVHVWSKIVFPGGVDIEPNELPDIDDPISDFLYQYDKVRDCGIKNFNPELYEKTIDAFLQQWDNFSVYNGILNRNEYWKRHKKISDDFFAPNKEGDPDGNDTEKE